MQLLVKFFPVFFCYWYFFSAYHHIVVLKQFNTVRINRIRTVAPVQARVVQFFNLFCNSAAFINRTFGCYNPCIIPVRLKVKDIVPVEFLFLAGFCTQVNVARANAIIIVVCFFGVGHIKAVQSINNHQKVKINTYPACFQVAAGNFNWFPNAV